MADKIFTVLSDGDTFDGVGGTEVVIVADRFADKTNAAGMEDVLALIGDGNVLHVHLDELMGDIVAFSTGMISRGVFHDRMDMLAADVREYLKEKR